jgi:hypothetical protein
MLLIDVSDHINSRHRSPLDRIDDEHDGSALDPEPVRRIAGDNGKLLGLKRYRPAIGRIEMGDAFQAAEQLVTIGVCVEIGSPILDDTKAHIEAVHLCEIDVLPHLTHRIGQILELMLL